MSNRRMEQKRNKIGETWLEEQLFEDLGKPIETKQL